MDIMRLTADDRCDRCGAQAYVQVTLPSKLKLLFCAHHAREVEPHLPVGSRLYDETVALLVRS